MGGRGGEALVLRAQGLRFSVSETVMDGEARQQQRPDDVPAFVVLHEYQP